MLPLRHSLIIQALPFDLEEGEAYLAGCRHYLKPLLKKGLVKKHLDKQYRLTPEGEKAKRQDEIDRFFKPGDFVKIDLSGHKYRRYDNHSGIVDSAHGNIPLAPGQIYLIVIVTRDERDNLLPETSYPRTSFLPKDALIRRKEQFEAEIG